MLHCKHRTTLEARSFTEHRQERININGIIHALVVVEVDVIARRAFGDAWPFAEHRQERVDVDRVVETVIVIEVDAVTDRERAEQTEQHRHVVAHDISARSRCDTVEPARIRRVRCVVCQR